MVPRRIATRNWAHACAKPGQAVGKQESCDEYKTMMYAALRQLFTEEEMTRIPDPEDCLPLDAFINELEEIVNKQ